jgi:flavin reductase (DIM6/NTAB) family NADH-FMN oxidoreductase RutF
MINHDPPMVTISVGAMKDTSRNITETKEFVVNLVSTPIVQAMNATSVDGPPELDEWLVSGLTPISSVT